MTELSTHHVYTEKDRNDKIGIALFCIYVFMSYVANGVIIPRIVNSLTLYAFLAYSVVYVLMKSKIKMSTTLVWYAIFALMSFFALLYSPEQRILGGAFYFVLVAFGLLACISQYRIDGKLLGKIVWSYALASPLMIIILIATGVLHKQTESGRLGEELFGNANIMANMMLLSVLYAMWLLVYSGKGFVKKTILIASIAITYYGMFLSGGRKFVIIPVIFLYVLLIFKKDRRGRKHIIVYTLLVAILAVALYLLIMRVPVFYESIGYRMEGLLGYLGDSQYDVDGSSKNRGEMIEYGLKMWKEKPFLGYGFDSFKYYNYSTTGHFYYSHNNWVEILFNTGIVGFCVYYWIYAKDMLFALKGKKKISDGSKGFVIATLIAMLLYEYGGINYSASGSIIMLYFVEIMLKQELDQKQIDEGRSLL